MKKKPLLFVTAGLLVVILAFSAFFITDNCIKTKGTAVVKASDINKRTFGVKTVKIGSTGNMIDMWSIKRSKVSKIVITDGKSLTLRSKKQIDNFLKLMNKTIIKRENLRECNGMSTDFILYYGNREVIDVENDYNNLYTGKNGDIYYKVIRGPLNYIKLANYLYPSHKK